MSDDNSESRKTQSEVSNLVTPAANVNLKTPIDEARVLKTDSQIMTGQEMELKLKNTQHTQRSADAISAEKALGWLKNGNMRFIKGHLRKDGQKKSDRERLATGQLPHAIVLSCSDSRVPPEIIFDQKLGEIFVIRTAGENLDASVVASIEYAVEHVGANLIVVMGHDSCGAVKAAAEIQSGQSAGSPFLDRLVSQIKARLQKTPRATASSGLIEEGWDNVHGIADELYKKSEIVRSAVEAGQVKIQSALYHLGSGKVEWQ